MRTGMEAVYTLLDIDRGRPGGVGSVYDVRDLLNATVKLRDGEKDHRPGSGIQGADGLEGDTESHLRLRRRES